jgi:hypothetical protein
MSASLIFACHQTKKVTASNTCCNCADSDLAYAAVASSILEPNNSTYLYDESMATTASITFFPTVAVLLTRLCHASAPVHVIGDECGQQPHLTKQKIILDQSRFVSIFISLVTSKRRPQRPATEQ